mmetsp:Transcript_9879/g.40817  ORF Transcript_9879/g.40817 Transcript_9879/m.40817 type:complete len:296 (+) Transcript_9879:495-1382(+)
MMTKARLPAAGAFGSRRCSESASQPAERLASSPPTSKPLMRKAASVALAAPRASSRKNAPQLTTPWRTKYTQKYTMPKSQMLRLLRPSLIFAQPLSSSPSASSSSAAPAPAMAVSSPSTLSAEGSPYEAGLSRTASITTPAMAMAMSPGTIMPARQPNSRAAVAARRAIRKPPMLWEVFHTPHQRPRSEPAYQFVSSLEHGGAPKPWKTPFSAHTAANQPTVLPAPKAMLSTPVMSRPSATRLRGDVLSAATPEANLEHACASGKADVITPSVVRSHPIDVRRKGAVCVNDSRVK